MGVGPERPIGFKLYVADVAKRHRYEYIDKWSPKDPIETRRKRALHKLIIFLAAVPILIANAHEVNNIPDYYQDGIDAIKKQKPLERAANLAIKGFTEIAESDNQLKPQRDRFVETNSEPLVIISENTQ